MPKRVILFSGASAVGKSAVIKALLPDLKAKGAMPCLCKIDCLQTRDDEIFKVLGLPCVIGLSQDICPDHFLVSNLPELWRWADNLGCDTLLVETAGLCHRCSPATKKMTAGCVLDCTLSSKAPAQLGPMLSQADFVVLTKIDMVSQAEREIIIWQLRQLNPTAEIFAVDGLVGYGAEPLAGWLYKQPIQQNYQDDILRHTMPSGVCSYCVGECRVGSAFQQGVVGKIDFEEAVCTL